MKIEKIVLTTEKEELEIIGARLLSIKEVETLLTKEERKYNYWWWLRSPGYHSYGAARVDRGGYVSHYGFLVNDDKDRVRPALIISNLKSSNFKIGDIFKIGEYEFKIISENLAWMHKQDIGNYCFRENWKADDANDYEKSDIKKYVDKWFKKLIKT